MSRYCDAERYIKGRWKESIRDIRETPTYGSLWQTDVSAILGMRLREITGALLVLEGKTIDEIMPGIDAVELKSSMTLFDAVCPDDIFSEVLDKYFRGERDKMTLSYPECSL